MINILLLLCSLWVTPTPTNSVYNFRVFSLDGKAIDLKKFKGKKILIVNTASKCGYTPQYEELEKLYKQYGKKLVIIGFPAGNFKQQELGTNKEIQEFCTQNYGVTFPMSGKVSVQGSDIDPLFKYLTTEENVDFTGDIKWNFEKFLINENGKLIHRYRSAVKPLDAAIVKNL